MSFLHLIPEFTKNVMHLIENKKIKLEPEFYIDHVCYRVATNVEYNQEYKFLLNFTKLINEYTSNGKITGVFKLYKPIDIAGKHTLSIIKLSTHTPGVSCVAGLEYAQIVTGDIDIKKFTEKYPDLNWNLYGLEKFINQHVKLQLDDSPLIYVKFHQKSLENLRTRSSFRDNELIYASKEGNHKLVQYFLENTTVKPDAQSQSALTYASRKGYHKVVELLVSAYDSFKINNDIMEIILQADKNKYVKVINVLLNKLSENYIVSDKENILLLAYNGCTDDVKRILKCSESYPEMHGNLAIKLATYNGHYDVVKLLLADSRVDVTADKNFALKWTIYNGHINIVKLLLNEKNINIATNNNVALRIAENRRHKDIITLLLTYPKVVELENAIKIVQNASREANTCVNITCSGYGNCRECYFCENDYENITDKMDELMDINN